VLAFFLRMKMCNLAVKENDRKNQSISLVAVRLVTARNDPSRRFSGTLVASLEWLAPMSLENFICEAWGITRASPVPTACTFVFLNPWWRLLTCSTDCLFHALLQSSRVLEVPLIQHNWAPIILVMKFPAVTSNAMETGISVPVTSSNPKLSRYQLVVVASVNR
jgi:hypothetical protein